MRFWASAAALLLLVAPLAAQEDFLDNLDQSLSFSAFSDQWRVRVSGLVDLEGYEFQAPAPGFIYAPGDALFVPRLTLFLDAQAGEHVYLFAQTRLDRGFDPSPGNLRLRPDEYAVRLMPGSGRAFSFQIGKFATVVGNWTSRHDSWNNPFITAPLLYDNLTAIWDAIPARSVGMLLNWAHLRPYPAQDADTDKQLRVPVIWGPSYATGASFSGAVGDFTYAAEVKNAGLSSRPDTWQPTDTQWNHPTYSARAGYIPNELWSFGVSASEGPYLLESAAPLLPPGRSFDSYRQTLFGQDAAFAYHHFQAWAEVYEVRYAIPGVTNADTLAYYVETKYKFTPQFFGALRWNQQLYGAVPYEGTLTRWDADVWRLDFAPTYRWSAHIQTKLQYSIQQGNADSRNLGHTLAAQLTIRF
jgi:hypothetical protein